MKKILIVNKNSFFLKSFIKSKKVKYYFVTKKNNLNFKILGYQGPMATGRAPC